LKSIAKKNRMKMSKRMKMLKLLNNSTKLPTPSMRKSFLNHSNFILVLFKEWETMTIFRVLNKMTRKKRKSNQRQRREKENDLNCRYYSFLS